MSEVRYHIDTIDTGEEKGTYCIRGWQALRDQVTITVKDEHGHVVESRITMEDRPDVVGALRELKLNKDCGFYIETSPVTGSFVYLEFVSPAGKGRTQVRLTGPAMQYKKAKNRTLRAINDVKAYGIRTFFAPTQGDPYNDDIYNRWAKKHMTKPRVLREQRRHTFRINPTISIVIPLYNTPEQFLRELLDSIVGQTYGGWQLCLADGSNQGDIKAFLDKNYPGERRIVYKKLDENRGISENTNEAVAMATGDYIMLSDHDDVLALDALYEIVKVINEHDGADMVYTDEDKINMDSTKYFHPHFKSDFNLDMLRSNNYICHIVVVRKSIVDQVGAFRSEYDGAQDFDFILRCYEKSKTIYHISKILYHWRAHPNSTANNPESKTYAYEAGRKAIEAHLERMNIPGKVTETVNLGRYRTQYAVREKSLISIIIPNKDHIDDLKQCLESIWDKSTYDNYEILIVENNSTEEETFAYYKELEQREDVRVIRWEKGFNYASINNFAVDQAKGDYILFLNNDVQIITPDWLEEMLGYCQRGDVGAVGAKLYYPDDTVQHAGVIIGLGGVAGHVFAGTPKSEPGYAARLICAHDLTAVTAACMMMPRKVFQDINGFDEGFQVAFNDVDLCMRIHEAGKLVVFDPYVELYHYESKSRGYEKTPEQLARFKGEVERFEKKWPEILIYGDPYYNANLTLKNGNCSLR
ncbi:MAG: glycosyltransferase family 2 protein [Lachnospiraceae bacterium]|nr:glycosyltransferase family 2 protein [Lachnospiraceae bacterium]